MKSTCLALFSASCGVAQNCDNNIHLVNKSAGQPLPSRNKTSLKVSRSPSGFFQNSNFMSSGHQLRRKKASPFMECKISLLPSTTSDFERKRYFSLYNSKVAILKMSWIPKWKTGVASYTLQIIPIYINTAWFYCVIILSVNIIKFTPIVLNRVLQQTIV